MKKLLSLMLSAVMLAGSISLMTLTSVNAAEIPDDAVSFDGHSYKVFTNRKYWQDAEDYCEDMGGHLVTITSDSEQQFINDLLTDYPDSDYMIGLHRSLNDFKIWVTGEDVSYSNWGANQPDNLSGNQNVAVITNGVRKGSSYYIAKNLWDDNNVNSYYFICEWDSEKINFEEKTSTWATKEMEEAYENNLIPDILVDKDLTQQITRAEFASVALKLYEALKDEETNYKISLPFTDISNTENYNDIKNAYALRIAVGTSPNTFEPDTKINREQLVTMLCRAIKKYKYENWSIENDSDYILLAGNVSKKFADDEDISDFARDSVYFMSEMGIVKGVDDTHFAPKNTTDKQIAEGYASATREQAIAISLRIFKKAELFN